MLGTAMARSARSVTVPGVRRHELVAAIAGRACKPAFAGPRSLVHSIAGLAMKWYAGSPAGREIALCPKPGARRHPARAGVRRLRRPSLARARLAR